MCECTICFPVDVLLKTHRVTSIIISRFILDLRYNPEENGNAASHNQTTIQFASRIEGNLGASLNSIWGSGTSEDQGDAESTEWQLRSEDGDNGTQIDMVHKPQEANFDRSVFENRALFRSNGSHTYQI